MLVTVRAALELNRTRAENRALHAELARRSALIGASAAMQQVRALIARVAPTEARVLITGESGTGKELVAAAIHAASRRSARAFVTVNCAAIPRDLVESEMFGHERGAFTGATERRLGRFELAHEGTLFLDEVGDLSPEAQAKLLRTLETGELQRIGAETLAAGRRPGRRRHQPAAGGGGGRRRLPGRPVLPAQRLPDPPAAAARAAGGPARAGGPPGRAGAAAPGAACSPSALDALAAYGWPGNVRELANLVERLSILCGPMVDASAVRQVLRGGSPPPPAPTALLGRPLSRGARRIRARAHARRADAGAGQHRRGRADSCRPIAPTSTAGCGGWASTGSRPGRATTSTLERLMRLLAGLLLLLAPAAARAQDSVIVIDPDAAAERLSVVRAGPPPEVVAELIAFYND